MSKEELKELGKEIDLKYEEINKLHKQIDKLEIKRKKVLNNKIND